MSDKHTTTLIFFDRSEGSVRIAYYDLNGRLVEDKTFTGVKSVEFRGGTIRSFQGVHHKITVYVVECRARVSARANILTVECA